MRTSIAAAASFTLALAPLVARGQAWPSGVLDPDPAAPVAAEPPGAPAQPGPAAQPDPPKPPEKPEQTLGFQIRLGGADRNRALFGAAFVASSSAFEMGVAGETVLDLSGSGQVHHDGGSGGYCQVMADGRCLGRTDGAITGFGGLVFRPRAFGTRLRLDLLGEVGWQISAVRERTNAGGSASWSDGFVGYPVYGARMGLAMHVFRAGYFGFGGFVRQAFEQPACVTTAGGCTRIDPTTAGVVFFGGADFGARP